MVRMVQRWATAGARQGTRAEMVRELRDGWSSRQVQVQVQVHRYVGTVMNSIGLRTVSPAVFNSAVRCVSDLPVSRLGNALEGH